MRTKQAGGGKSRVVKAVVSVAEEPQESITITVSHPLLREADVLIRQTDPGDSLEKSATRRIEDMIQAILIMQGGYLFDPDDPHRVVSEKEFVSLCVKRGIP